MSTTSTYDTSAQDRVDAVQARIRKDLSPLGEVTSIDGYITPFQDRLVMDSVVANIETYGWEEPIRVNVKEPGVNMERPVYQNHDGSYVLVERSVEQLSDPGMSNGRAQVRKALERAKSMVEGYRGAYSADASATVDDEDDWYDDDTDLYSNRGSTASRRSTDDADDVLGFFKSFATYFVGAFTLFALVLLAIEHGVLFGVLAVAGVLFGALLWIVRNARKELNAIERDHTETAPVEPEADPVEEDATLSITDPSYVNEHGVGPYAHQPVTRAEMFYQLFDTVAERAAVMEHLAEVCQVRNLRYGGSQVQVYDGVRRGAKFDGQKNPMLSFQAVDVSKPSARSVTVLYDGQGLYRVYEIGHMVRAAPVVRPV